MAIIICLPVTGMTSGWIKPLKYLTLFYQYYINNLLNVNFNLLKALKEESTAYTISQGGFS